MLGFSKGSKMVKCDICNYVLLSDKYDQPLEVWQFEAVPAGWRCFKDERGRWRHLCSKCLYKAMKAYLKEYDL